ncbi:MAG: hypothetical protein ABI836_05370 [Gemmatimonadota bacterium]
MSNLVLRAASLAGLVSILACGSAGPLSNPWGHTPAPVAGVPEHFIPDSSFTQPPASDSTCLMHLVDPATQIRLIMVRSTGHGHVTDSTVRSAVGDYKVEPEERFGVGEHERLRVACATGRPLGKVPE